MVLMGEWPLDKLLYLPCIILDELEDYNGYDFSFNVDKIAGLSRLTEYFLSKGNERLNKREIQTLKELIEIGNITYNNTDRDLLPIEDGIYDLLLELYKEYNPNYRIGAKPMIIQPSSSDTIIEENQKIEPIKYLSDEEKKKIDDMLFPELLHSDKTFTKRDLLYQPIRFETQDQYITKRLRNTSHNHPNLVGTLDKCKYVLDKQAIDAEVYDDPRVKILERDFFLPLIQKGIINMQDTYVMIAELKYDGVSVVGEIENGMITSAITRGDVEDSIASDLTPLFEGYVFPNAFHHEIEPFGMKFEAIVNYRVLQQLNSMRSEKYINPRTCIIGLTNASDARQYRDLITLIPLATSLEDKNGEPIDRLVEIEFMNRFYTRDELLRFQVISGNYTELMFQINRFVQEAEFARDYLPFMYDGVVLSFYDPKIRKLLGRENSVNKYSMAIKFNAEKKNTMFLGYTFEVGQNGVITPMIHYQAIEFMGARHTKSSGHSYERFKNLALKVGDIVSVEYRHDVMPYVSALDIQKNRDNPNPVFEFPIKCPICGTRLVESESGKSIYCSNIKCKGRSYKRMESTLGKLGIRDFAYESIKLLDVTSLRQLLEMDENDLNILGPNDRFNLLNQLNQLKSKPEWDYKLIGALGFSNVASKTFKLIFKHYDLYEFYQWFSTKKASELLDELTRIRGIGFKTIETIDNEFPVFVDDIVYIIEHFNVLPYKHSGEQDLKKIVFTGFRDDVLSDKLSQLGFDANPTNSLTKDTFLLVVPSETTNTSKTQKAMKFGVKMLPVQQVWNIINSGQAL